MSYFLALNHFFLNPGYQSMRSSNDFFILDYMCWSEDCFAASENSMHIVPLQTDMYERKQGTTYMICPTTFIGWSTMCTL